MLINEWQTVPKLWDAVRYTVDHRHAMGQFILTGSAVPDTDAEKEREQSMVTAEDRGYTFSELGRMPSVYCQDCILKHLFITCRTFGL